MHTQGVISLQDGQVSKHGMAIWSILSKFTPSLQSYTQVDVLFGKLGTHSKCAGATLWVRYIFSKQFTFHRPTRKSNLKSFIFIFRPSSSAMHSSLITGAGRSLLAHLLAASLLVPYALYYFNSRQLMAVQLPLRHPQLGITLIEKE